MPRRVRTVYTLRPYQHEVARAVAASISGSMGLTFTVEIARQGGKNEISAQLETVLLGVHCNEDCNLVKCSPTYKPQAAISMIRLKERLNDVGLAGIWVVELGNIIRVKCARAIFLSAEETANVVGNTADLLLEVDEAQDVGEEKFTKEFKPMGSTTNVTTVLYGTTWDDSTLLEKMKQTNLELEKKDGIQRHFRYDWQEVAKYNPDYQAYVESERQRLGEDHPLFLTQYRLLPLHGGGCFLSPLQQAQLQGDHPRQRQPQESKLYVAGIDLAGEAETAEADYLKSLKPRQDSTVVTIGELDFSSCGPLQPLPAVRVVELYSWKGTKHTEVFLQLADILKSVWRCRRVVVDATGIGQPIASFLFKAIGSRIVPFTFTAQSKSELGFNLLAAINSGRLKMFRGDGSDVYREFRFEMEKARADFRPSRTMNFFLDPAEGHDDFLMSLALMLDAAGRYEPREARGSSPYLPLNS